MEMKQRGQKTDYFIIPTLNGTYLPPSFQVVVPVTDERGYPSLLGKMPSLRAEDVEEAISHLSVFHSRFIHIEAKDSAAFQVITHLTENPITQFLGRARFSKNSVTIPGVGKWEVVK